MAAASARSSSSAAAAAAGPPPAGGVWRLELVDVHHNHQMVEELFAQCRPMASIRLMTMLSPTTPVDTAAWDEVGCM